MSATTQRPRGPPRREHRLLRARAARRRHSGRAGLGARCARGGARGRRRRAGGFLLDAARGVREAARAFGAVRPGVPDLLPQARLSRAADRDDVAGDDRRAGRRPTSRRPRSACSMRCSRAREKIEREKQEIELDARFTVSDREVLQKKDFAQMTAAEIAQAKDAIKRMVLALRRGQDAAARAASARPPHRSAPHAARQHEGRRRADRPEIPRAEDQDAADRGAARYLRLDEPVHAAVPAFPARRHRCAQARAHLPVRHAADQRDARAEGEGPGRGAGGVLGERARLVGRHAHRHLACTCSTSSGRAAC